MKTNTQNIAKLFLLFSFFFFLNTNAQAPDKMSYQAVIRNASNALVVSQGVGMKISILQGSATGTEVYKELFNPNPTTNANGLVSVIIGTGIPITGTFASINWSAGPYFIKTETDPTGGTNYTITATTQLMSVPYAMSAKSAQTLNGLSGTTNMISKFTSTNTFGNSQIFDDGTKIGIGTVLPDAKAHIKGGQLIVEHEPATYANTNTHLILKPLTGINAFPAISFDGLTIGAMVGLDTDGTIGIFKSNGFDYTAIHSSAFNITSDERLKKEIHHISSSEYDSYLQQIRNIQSVTYLYNNETLERKMLHYPIVLIII